MAECSTETLRELRWLTGPRAWPRSCTYGCPSSPNAPCRQPRPRRSSAPSGRHRTRPTGGRPCAIGTDRWAKRRLPLGGSAYWTTDSAPDMAGNAKAASIVSPAASVRGQGWTTDAVGVSVITAVMGTPVSLSTVTRARATDSVSCAPPTPGATTTATANAAAAPPAVSASRITRLPRFPIGRDQRGPPPVHGAGSP